MSNSNLFDSNDDLDLNFQLEKENITKDECDIFKFKEEYEVDDNSNNQKHGIARFDT